MNRFVKSNQSVNEGLGMDIASNLAGAASFLPMGRGAKSALRGLAALGMLSSADSGIDEVPVGSGFDAASAARGAAAAGWAMGALGGLRKKPIPVPVPSQPTGRVNVRVRPFRQEPAVVRVPTVVPGQIPNLKITDPNRLLPQLNPPTVANLAVREPEIAVVPGKVISRDWIHPKYRNRGRIAKPFVSRDGGSRDQRYIPADSRLVPFNPKSFDDADTIELAKIANRQYLTQPQFVDVDRSLIGAQGRADLIKRANAAKIAAIVNRVRRQEAAGPSSYIDRAALGQASLMGDSYTPELMHNALMESMSGYCKKKI